MKTCYYELLGVNRKCTQDELKAAYKKVSIKWHPDKNRDKIDEAKEKFQEINEAYQILSDLNERSWYDAHREQILMGKEKDDMTKEDMDLQAFGFNIWKYFSASCFKSFEDNDDLGFYQVYREIFEKIKYEEQQAWEYSDEQNGNYVKLPGFGDSSYDTEKTKEFYLAWNSFTSFKTFAFADEYNPNEAPNRQVRRAIEKENKKLRQVEKKNYIQTIKDLVNFVKKRDPRWTLYQNAMLHEELKKEDERKEKQKKEAEAKAELRKQAKLIEMARYDETAQYQMDIDDRQEIIKSIEDFYCEICDQEFKSEQQFAHHKQSQKHHKNKQRLMKEVAMDYEKQQKQAGKNVSPSKESNEDEEQESSDEGKQQKPKELTQEDLDKIEERKQKQAKLAEERKKKKQKKKVNKAKKEEEEEEAERLEAEKKKEKVLKRKLFQESNTLNK